jgi:hypothetical protein
MKVLFRRNMTAVKYQAHFLFQKSICKSRSVYVGMDSARMVFWTINATYLANITDIQYFRVAETAAPSLASRTVRGPPKAAKSR